MNFKVTSNPPYDHDLFLQIILKLYSNKSFINQCVVLCPSVPFLYISKLIGRNHFDKVDKIKCPIGKTFLSQEKARQGFDAVMSFRLGIFDFKFNELVDSERERERESSLSFEEQLMKKIITKIDTDRNFKRFKTCNFSKDLKHFIPIKEFNICIKYDKIDMNPFKVYGYFQNGLSVNGLTYSKEKELNKASTMGDEKNTVCYIFDTPQEAYNMWQSFQSYIPKYVCGIQSISIHIYQKHQLFMEKYDRVYTDEDYKKYLNLTDKEYEFIVNWVKNAEKLNNKSKIETGLGKILNR